MQERTVYLDNNATTQVSPEVRDVMVPFFCELYGNPSSMHAFGGKIARYLERAREEAARFINASPDEIIFTSCATESDNTAIRGVADMVGPSLKVATTAVEHPAVLQPVRRLKALGHETIEVGVDSLGALDLDALEKFLKSSGPKMVSAMWANNETGVVFPIAKIAEMCREHGAVFHTDAVQAVGHIPVELGRLNVDLLSMSAHKFGGPKGIGALIARRGVRLSPRIEGGGQEKGIRSGTENTAGIAGFAAAAEWMLAQTERGEALRAAKLRLYARLRA